jgi:hypothetical protein
MNAVCFPVRPRHVVVLLALLATGCSGVSPTAPSAVPTPASPAPAPAFAPNARTSECRRWVDRPAENLHCGFDGETSGSAVQ